MPPSALRDSVWPEPRRSNAPGGDRRRVLPVLYKFDTTCIQAAYQCESCSTGERNRDRLDVYDSVAPITDVENPSMRSNPHLTRFFALLIATLIASSCQAVTMGPNDKYPDP